MKLPKEFVWVWTYAFKDAKRDKQKVLRFTAKQQSDGQYRIAANDNSGFVIVWGQDLIQQQYDDGDIHIVSHRLVKRLPQKFEFYVGSVKYEGSKGRHSLNRKPCIRVPVPSLGSMHAEYDIKRAIDYLAHGDWIFAEGYGFEQIWKKKADGYAQSETAMLMRGANGDRLRQAVADHRLQTAGAGRGFEVLQDPPADMPTTFTGSTNIYRPDVTTRKEGKIRVQLVDDGFPLALRELARVMTWAQEAKGYKDHDWLNLPNAEIELAAAASRHRTDYIKQRVVEGLPADQCVDHESKIVHKAHEAFGVLAQLELLLRGKFDK